MRDCAGEADELGYVRELEADVRRADPRALADTDCWWAVILEQARDGML
jgi:hypothetical protein